MTQRTIAVVVLAPMLLLALIGAGPSAGDDGKGAFDTQEAFDALVQAQGRRLLDGDNNSYLAWGESYVMMGLITMYQATGETRYLDALIERADEVLSRRDSEVGAIDYLGRSLPGWSVGAHYSIGEIRLPGAHGHPTLYLRTALTGYNHQTQITVTPAQTPGTFSLRVVNERYRVEEQFEDLTMDPGADNYAVARILASESAQPYHHARLHAEDLGSASTGLERNPAAVETALETSRYLWPVHQGAILEPMVLLARTVMAHEELRSNARYRQKAEQYISAAEELFRMLDEQCWRDNDAGEGWYQLEKGAPVWMDGCDEPHNHNLTVGSAMLHLATATGSPLWRDRAEKMARTIRNDMQYVAENDLYIWPYWWSKGRAFNGWAPEDDISRNTPAFRPRQTMEDFSHGSIEIRFAYQCYRDGILFTRQDMERLANTFMHNIVRRTEDGALTFADRVDGGDPVGRYDLGGAAWPLLAEFSPAILDVFRQMRAESPWNGYAVWIAQSANMNLVRARLDQAAADR